MSNQHWNTQDQLRVLRSELKGLDRQVELMLSAIVEIRALLSVILERERNG